MGKHIQDKTGGRYGTLLVISFKGTRRIPSGRMQSHWRCRCDCGKEVVLATGFLRKVGGNRSCGCKRATNADKFASVMLNIFKKGHEKSRWRRGWVRERVFQLTIQDVKRLIYSPCHYCGVEPSNTMRNYEAFRWNGIDRVDNSIGYISSNCVPCCKNCNYAKNKMPVHEFYEWIGRLAAHQAKSGRVGSVAEGRPCFVENIGISRDVAVRRG